MPVPWFVLPGAATLAWQAPQQTAIDELLTIEWRTIQVFPQEGRVVYGGGVKAVYGVTTLKADSITLHYEGELAESGMAEGNVRLEDPEGTVEAAKIEFDWQDKTGSADRVRVKVDMLELEAQRVEIQPGIWRLANVRVIECSDGPAIVSLWSPEVIIEPGRRTVARKVDVSLFGQKLLTLKRHEISQDRRRAGLRLPSVSLRGGGVGASWRSGLVLSESSAFDFSISSFPGRRPSAGLTLSQSFSRSEEARPPVVPRSELEELFNYGYFENINVKKPEDEREYLSRPRSTLSLGSVWNTSVGDRDNSESINKPWDIAVEYGSGGGLSQMHQLRLQRVEDVGERSETRLVGITSVLSPAWRLSDQAFGQVRADGRAYFGGEAHSGWGRLNAELIAKPSKNTTLGLGYSIGSNVGASAFEFDRLPREQTLYARADLHFGPTKLFVLGKYAPRGGGWFDHEFAIYQVAGCFEPYFIFRKQAGTASFGLNWRVFETLDRLKGGLPKRTRGNRPLLPPPEGWEGF